MCFIFTAGTGFLWWTYADIKSDINNDIKHKIPLLDIVVKAETAFLVYSIIATVLTVSRLSCFCSYVRNPIKQIRIFFLILILLSNIRVYDHEHLSVFAIIIIIFAKIICMYSIFSFIGFQKHVQLSVQSVPITTKIVNSKPVHGEAYSIQHFVITFVSDLRQVCGFFLVLRFPPPIKLTATI